MDFTNRSSRPTGSPQTVNPGDNDSQPARHGGDNNNKSVKGLGGKLNFKQNLNPLYLVLLFSVAVVLLGTTWLAIFYRPLSEARHVDGEKLQAVFLEGGQVYFGKITRLDDNYVRMHDIYYLRVDQQVQPRQGETVSAAQDVSLVKLGCELHGPRDLMLINHDKVLFWENLKEDGQVAKAVKQFKDANPNGQECAQPSEGSDASSGAGAGSTVPAGTESAPAADDTAETEALPPTEQ